MYQHETTGVCLTLPLLNTGSPWLCQDLINDGRRSGENVKLSGYPRPQSSLRTAVQSCRILGELSPYSSDNFCSWPGIRKVTYRWEIFFVPLLYFREVSLESQHSSLTFSTFTKNWRAWKREWGNLEQIWNWSGGLFTEGCGKQDQQADCRAGNCRL